MLAAAHPGSPFGAPVTYDPSTPGCGAGQPIPGVPGAKDPDIRVRLDNRELWERFDSIGTEMIITKAGR